MAKGYGYEITVGDVMEACSSILKAASATGVTEDQIKAKILDAVTTSGSGNAHYISMIKTRFNV